MIILGITLISFTLGITCGIAFMIWWLEKEQRERNK